MTVDESKHVRNQYNALLLERIDELARYLFPQGCKKGSSWRVGSLDINLRSGMWGDWDGSTDSMSRNLVDLWIYSGVCDFKTAVEEIRQWLGISKSELGSSASIQNRNGEQAKKLVLPLLEKPSLSELRKLSELRSIAVDPLKIAVDRGFLWTYTDQAENARAWLLTDSARKLAVGRKIDGTPWELIGAKSKSLKGSWGNWPIGVMESEKFPAIGLVEGTPDFLAVIAHACASGVEDRIAPVCLSGASMSIPESVLPRFAGKRVRIFAHDDKWGIAAANRWHDQLHDAGAVIDGYSFDGLVQTDGKPVQDLNDLCRIDYDCWEANREVVEGVMDFALERSGT